MSTQISEQSLIQQAQNGDLEAFNQLVLRYQDGIYRYAMSLVNDHDLADDITQESFIKAFHKIKSLNGDSFRPWLFKITTNTVRDMARRSARHPMIPLHPKDETGEDAESPEWLIAPNVSVENTVLANESSARLYQLLSELPEVYRSILTLIDLQEMDYIEAAKILNIPMGTVKSRLARARLHMKGKLQDANQQPAFANRLRALAI